MNIAADFNIDVLCIACGIKAIAGKIATGDTFVGDAETKKAIEEKCHPDCVEMEGAAVSQIAGRNGVPCVILRAMSDNADASGYEAVSYTHLFWRLSFVMPVRLTGL